MRNHSRLSSHHSLFILKRNGVSGAIYEVKFPSYENRCGLTFHASGTDRTCRLYLILVISVIGCPIAPLGICICSNAASVGAISVMPVTLLV